MMTPTQRLEKLLGGKQAGRPLYSAWGHVMNYADRNAEAFARETIALEEIAGFDFIKVMSNPYYLLEDMGIELIPPKDFRFCVTRSPEHILVPKAEDWDKVKFPDLKGPAIRRETEAIKRINEYYQGDVPVLPSIFTPLMWITYSGLYPGEIDRASREKGQFISLLEEYLLSDEERTRRVVSAFEEVNEQYMDLLLDAGVYGFFYATDVARDFWSSPDIFAEYEREADLKSLNHIRNRAKFVLFHICGDDHLRFDWVQDYPFDAVNWNDQSKDNPSMKDMHRKHPDWILTGGLDKDKDLIGPDDSVIADTIRRRVKTAVGDTEGRCILSGGCAWPIEAAARFYLLREVMERL